MDWKEYIAETSNSQKLCDLLCTAHYEYYLELINTIDLPLFYVTDLNHISMQINKKMEKNRVKPEQCNK